MKWSIPKRVSAAAGFRPFVLLLAALALLTGAAPGLSPSKARAQCAVVADNPLLAPNPLLHRASVTLPTAPVPAHSVEISFLGHSSFLIRTPGGVSAVTDLSDSTQPPLVPDIATMNFAHATHYTDFPDPAIKHVLRGWIPNGIATHDLRLSDLRVRNISTNTRDYAGGTLIAGNSIFVFELAELCIAHLGHLHHPLEPAHLGALGKIDILMVPVDGGLTLDHERMAGVIERIGPSVVIPMHYFGDYTLDSFLAHLKGRREIRRLDTPTVRLSRATLPFNAVLVLAGDGGGGGFGGFDQ